MTIISKKLYHSIGPGAGNMMKPDSLGLFTGPAEGALGEGFCYLGVLFAHERSGSRRDTGVPFMTADGRVVYGEASKTLLLGNYFAVT